MFRHAFVSIKRLIDTNLLLRLPLTEPATEIGRWGMSLKCFKYYPLDFFCKESFLPQSFSIGISSLEKLHLIFYRKLWIGIYNMSALCNAVTTKLTLPEPAQELSAKRPFQHFLDLAAYREQSYDVRHRQTVWLPFAICWHNCKFAEDKNS